METSLFSAVVTDSDNDILTFAPVANAFGSDDILLTLTDSGGLTATQTIMVTLNAQNDAPVITTTAPAGATEDIEYIYNASATDPEVPPQTLEWGLLDAPSGMTVSPTAR